MFVDSEKDAFIVGEFGAGKWESSGESGCVHIAGNKKLVFTVWKGGFEGFNLRIRGNFTDYD